MEPKAAREGGIFISKIPVQIRLSKARLQLLGGAASIFDGNSE